MIKFDRKLGTLFNDRGAVIATGIWAGHGDARNDPSREREKMIGPLPAGMYTMRDPRDSDHLGSYVIDLEPHPGNQMYGRGLFRIHGDNKTPDPNDASNGCIIAPRSVRERCHKEQDRLLKVV